MQVGDTGQRYDGTHGRFPHIDLFQPVKLIELADLDFGHLLGFMVIDHHRFLVNADRTPVDLAHTDPADVFVVVNGADQDLQRLVGIPLRCRNAFQDGLKQRLHAVRLIRQAAHRVAAFRGSVDKGAVQLLVAGVKVHQKFKHFIRHLIRPCFRAVDLVHAHDHIQIQFQRFLQNEFGLGHRPFKGIHHQDHTVYHLQHTFDFPAEIRMPRCVNDIDLGSLICDRRVLGKDGDASLPFQVAAVHDTFRHILVLTEHAALFEQFIHQCGLSMVNMRYDRYISDIIPYHKISSLFCFCHPVLFTVL